jgi:sortase A
MKKIFILLLIIGGLVGSLLFLKPKASKDLPANSRAETTQTSPLEDDKKVVVEKPSTFSIPSLNVNASVESVGLDKKGNMDVPKDDMNVAWYNLGYKPGEKGSAVLAGHYDTRTGGPAVFYNLNKLKPGDSIFIDDENGNKLEYEVEETKTYPFDQFPLKAVFASNDEYRLNLITCEGTFNKSARNYSHRTVVYSKLKR